MTNTRIYGIKNCDTMKKALKWLEANAIAFEFMDYKKSGVDMAVLTQALSEHGWEIVINKRGTTWRQLDKDIQDHMNDHSALDVAKDNPSIIKRPLLLHGGKTYIGFKEAEYSEIFA